MLKRKLPMAHECYAYMDEDGIDVVGSSPEIVRERLLREVMGWRLEHPICYDQDDEWSRLMEVGKLVRVSIAVVEAVSVCNACEDCHECPAVCSCHPEVTRCPNCERERTVWLM